MLTYSFTNLKNESLYTHLYQCIRQDIIDGKLISGEKLPSKRSFAKNLGVSTITIENAYAQLEAALNNQINSMEATHPEYEEYRYQVD